VDVDADHLDARETRGLGIDLAGPRDRDAELVLGPAGGDLRVRAGVDVGVDADGDRRGPPHAGGGLGERAQLGLGFHVELADAALERHRISSRVLPTPEKTMRSPGTPAARARRYSPSDTTSAPAPRRASTRMTARLEFAFSA
jgi:hypothetical protein